MELIHASKFLQEWFNKLSPETQAWLIKTYWIAVPLGLMFLFYAVVREEKVSESGKVTVKWYQPTQWVAHFKQIKADNEAKFARDNSNFYMRLQQLLAISHQASDIVYDVLFVVVGLLGVAGMLFSLFLNPLKTWWMFIPCAIAVYIGVKSMRKLLNKN